MYQEVDYWPKGMWICDDEGNEIKLPSHKEVCHRCQGEGKHVNPSVDGNGLDPNDPDLDEDFWEGYMGGAYDVRCEDCNGNNVIDVVDEDALSPEVKEAFEDWRNSHYDTEAIYRMERMMGA